MKENKHKIYPYKYEETIKDMMSDIEDEVYYCVEYEDMVREGLNMILKKIADSKKLK